MAQLLRAYEVPCMAVFIHSSLSTASKKANIETFTGAGHLPQRQFFIYGRS